MRTTSVLFARTLLVRSGVHPRACCGVKALIRGARGFGGNGRGAGLELLERIQGHASANRVAVATEGGAEHTYGSLLEGSAKVAAHLCARSDLAWGSRVALQASPSLEFAQALLGIWRAGCVAVPLAVSHPPAELAYALREVDAALVLGTKPFAPALIALAAADAADATARRLAFVPLEALLAGAAPSADDAAALFSDPAESDDALVIFTSGTTGRPKGVVSTHGNLRAQTAMLVDAWAWAPQDRILHILPLHHVHGLGNKLLCALWAGASVMFCPPQPASVWARLAAADRHKLTLFMAVPTNYALLIREFEAATGPGASAESRANMERAVAGAAKLRLMVSGSMALPTPVLDRWRAITGHTLLERYGMTELGMALSQPLDPNKRAAGTVGTPLPSVRVKIVGADGAVLASGNSEVSSASSAPSSAPASLEAWRPRRRHAVRREKAAELAALEASGNARAAPRRSAAAPVAGAADEPVADLSGELCVKGPAVFDRYWNMPDATAAAFDADGFFRTGDVASFDAAAGAYRILGRASVDIIKSGGYKVSALEVERVLLELNALAEVAVVGVPSEAFGQALAAVVVLRHPQAGSHAPPPPQDSRDGEALAMVRAFGASRLAPYKLPTRAVVVGAIPKNAMGKVNKKELLALFADPTAAPPAAAVK